ncbi:hypothetical protein HER39_05675 [Arthrobacter deserti]|uniref:Uncharacterized protein n=1 Tax=Arthrobacter deserti TaxID=1742687 RepID=A0ABX1JL95_9MICC|nr:hypothetical protein [Arthrobacter deserti]
MNELNALVSATLMDPPAWDPPALSVALGPPPADAQALSARAATAATPIALEVRPKRIPPP